MPTSMVARGDNDLRLVLMVCVKTVCETLFDDLRNQDSNC